MYGGLIQIYPADPKAVVLPDQCIRSSIKQGLTPSPQDWQCKKKGDHLKVLFNQDHHRTLLWTKKLVRQSGVSGVVIISRKQISSIQKRADCAFPAGRER